MSVIPLPPSPDKLKSKESSTEHETTGIKARESEEGMKGCSTKEPTLINQSMLNDQVRDFDIN